MKLPHVTAYFVTSFVFFVGCTTNPHNCTEQGQTIHGDHLQDIGVAPQREKLVISVDRNLTGTLAIELIGLTSVHEDAMKKQEQMAAFLAGEHKTLAQRMARSWCVDCTSVAVERKTELICDLRMTCTFQNFLGVMSKLSNGFDLHEVSKTSRLFSVRLLSTNDVMSYETTGSVLAIRYEGTVISHNAHKMDRTHNTLIWEQDRMYETGVQFVLDIGTNN